PVMFDELSDHIASKAKSKPGEDFSHYLIEKKKEVRQNQNSAQSRLTPEQLVAQGAPSLEVAEAVKAELIPDRKQLRGFIRYSGKTKDVSLSFSANMLGEAIEFDALQKRLIIHKIPESLLKQLKGKSKYDDEG
ncbi:MAG: nucleoid-associated protein, partial [Oleibacter sp.]|nr:nucleoid-associated protein [Thalassolituus sp.]